MQVFYKLEARRAELGVEDVHLSMSTLEDVFLRIAKDSEMELARDEQVFVSSRLCSADNLPPDNADGFSDFLTELKNRIGIPFIRK